MQFVQVGGYLCILVVYRMKAWFVFQKGNNIHERISDKKVKGCALGELEVAVFSRPPLFTVFKRPNKSRENKQIATQSMAKWNACQQQQQQQ